MGMTMIEKLNVVTGGSWYPTSPKHAELIGKYADWEHDETDILSITCACSKVKVLYEGVSIRKVLFHIKHYKKGYRVTVHVSDF